MMGFSHSLLTSNSSTLITNCVKESLDQISPLFSSYPSNFFKGLPYEARQGFTQKTIEKLEAPSLYSNIFIYSQSLKTLYNNLKENFNSLDNTNYSLFKNIIENLSKKLLQEEKDSWSFLLYAQLSEIFITHLIWERDKSIFLYTKKTAGIYIIYNKKSLVTYIGESQNIEKRFYDHYNMLLQGLHYNKGLQNDCNSFGIESFYYLVVKYGEVFEDLSLAKRSEKL